MTADLVEHASSNETTPDSRDARLARVARSCDAEEMSRLYLAHLDQIYNYCYRRVRSPADAEDLCATVFERCWKQRRRIYYVDGSILPWLYGVASNVCRRHLRTRQRHVNAMSRLQIVDLGSDPDGHGDPQIAMTNDAEQRERADRALTALAALPDRLQETFVLVTWHALSYEEAARVLGIPIGTVRSRMSRARAGLHEQTTSTDQGEPS